MNQKTFLTNLCKNNKDAVIIGSLGTISYDLTDIPHDNKILIRGAMGSVVGIGIGYALAKPKQKVIVVVGDGSFLMKLGSLATMLHYRPKNLKIAVINNESFKSTGGQPTNFYTVEGFISMFIEVFKPKDNLAP